jgi:hypothetical protein
MKAVFIILDGRSYRKSNSVAHPRQNAFTTKTKADLLPGNRVAGGPFHPFAADEAAVPEAGDTSLSLEATSIHC